MINGKLNEREVRESARGRGRALEKLFLKVNTHKDVGDAAVSVIGTGPVRGLDIEAEHSSGVFNKVSGRLHLTTHWVNGEFRRVLPTAEYLIADLPV